MGGTDWFVTIFLAIALAERLCERRFSNRAVRGECKMEWSYTALHGSYAAVFVASAVEYFWRRQGLQLPVTVAGLGLFAIALVVRLTAIRTLGKFWSLHLEIRPEHQLVTHGIYRYVRHPAYLAILLEVISVPLVANAFFAFILTVAVYVPLLWLRWRREEAEMTAKFGEQYARYCREVPAFLPWPSATNRNRKAA
jgi:protein-S-isoprenylcysteine O-methyltransferase Ste14